MIKILILLYILIGFIWVIWDFRKVLRYALFVLRDSLALLIKGEIELLNPKRVQTMDYGYKTLESPFYAGQRDYKTGFLKILFWPLFLLGLIHYYRKRRKRGGVRNKF